MVTNSDFESQTFNPFSVTEELQNNELDPDVNYCLDEISFLDTKYYVSDEVKDKLKSLQLNSFSVLHLNIRSMKKHFEVFQDFIESLNFKFSAICLSETWLQAHEISDSNFQLPGYYSFHLTTRKNRGGGVCISCKFRKDLQVNSKAMLECLCVEVENKNSKNIVLNLVYRPPNGDHKELEKYFKSSLSKREISHKDIILAGDFNITLLDFDANKKVQNFVNLMFRFGMIPTINKPMLGLNQGL